MTRLFDATGARKSKDAQDEVKRRAAEADKALAEIEDLDEASQKLKAQLAKASSAVTPIRYAEYRAPGSKWHIEHARVGDDYIFQMFPLKKPSYAWQDIVTLMVGAMDVIFPPSIHIHYVPPTENEFRPFYTIKVSDVVATPGWDDGIRDRTLRSLAAVPAWDMKPVGPS